MQCKNKHIKVDGGIINGGNMKMAELDCTVTNDKRGKTLSINDGITQFTIPFEPIEKYLK